MSMVYCVKKQTQYSIRDTQYKIVVRGWKYAVRKKEEKSEDGEAQKKKKDEKRSP